MRGDRQNHTRSPSRPVTHFKIRLYQKWRTATREKPGPYVPVLWFLRRKLISTEEALFYGGSFLRRKLISTEEAHFYGGSCFLRRKLISTEEAHFYGGGSFLRRKLISTEEADFHWGGQFLSSRLIFVWKTRTIAQRKQGFNPERVCFTVCSSGTSGPPYNIGWHRALTVGYRACCPRIVWTRLQ